MQIRFCGALAMMAGVAAAHAAPSDIVVTAPRPTVTPTASTATIDQSTIQTTINAVNVEDALKYLPSLIVRKRHIGDTQSPLATRTSGVGASARSLIYADGALLSALIGNNNTIASPRWSIVSPQEIARIDVLYGPFAAAYPGNSIGAVVSITTRLPDRLEATAQAGVSLQHFDQYDTRGTYPAYQFGATIGGRFGPLALFASAERVDSRSQPLLYVTATVPAATSAAGTPATGGVAALNRTGVPIRVLGASGFEHQRQTRAKLKAALDLGADTRLTYVGALFRNDNDATAETFLTAGSEPAFAGSLNLDGRLYTVAASAFSGGVYTQDQRHWSHSLTLADESGDFTWRVIGTLYDFDHDVQRQPTIALPAARAGGAGTITRLDGTGWRTLDASAGYATGTHALSAGAHGDVFELASNRFDTVDWRTGGEGRLNLRSAGHTRTGALWAQDAWSLTPKLTLTVGGRQEYWRAYRGANFSLTPAISATQPTRSFARFSPKASLAFMPASGWTARASWGRAWRFPTVAELYQIVTTPVAAVPNPTLRPERASSAELAIEHADAHGNARIAVFNENIRDALISQLGPLPGTTTLATFVQNVDRTRARGIEASLDRREIFANVDLSASLTYAEAETRRDAAFPAAIGKRLPQVPRWKASLVATWRPVAPLSLTAAARYASRLYGTLDNSDVIGHTYQGFEGYLVADARARLTVTPHWALSVGVDNITDKRYFLFHPFPGRTATVQVDFRL